VTSTISVGSSYSLATATRRPSGDNARSRTGNEHLTRMRSKVFVSREYKETVPSSEPTMKKSFYYAVVSFQIYSSLLHVHVCLLTSSTDFFSRTVATTAVLLSGVSCMFTGSASEFVSKMRMVSLAPTVTSLLPLGVYARKVGPFGSGEVMVSKVSTVSHVCGLRAGRMRGPSPGAIAIAIF